MTRKYLIQKEDTHAKINLQVGRKKLKKKELELAQIWDFLEHFEGKKANRFFNR